MADALAQSYVELLEENERLSVDFTSLLNLLKELSVHLDNVGWATVIVRGDRFEIANIAQGHRRQRVNVPFDLLERLADNKQRTDANTTRRREIESQLRDAGLGALIKE